MRAALKEAQKAAQMDEVPVGCVIVRDHKIIAKAHNLRETRQSAYAHAEVLAMQKASRKLKTWCLKDCDLYVTLEPCMMCIGTSILSRVHAVIYGAADPKGGCTKTLIDIDRIPELNSHPIIVEGVLQQECTAVLKEFFKEKRKRRKRDPASFEKHDQD